MLDTSTVILLPRLRDPTLLPAEPLITAVIWLNSPSALWSRTAILESGQLARRICSRPKPTLIRSHSTRLLHEHSGKLPRHFGEAPGRSVRAYDAMIRATPPLPAISAGSTVSTSSRSRTPISITRVSTPCPKRRGSGASSAITHEEAGYCLR